MKIQNQLGYIKGITFAPFHRRGSLSTQTARDSFDYMIEHTAADFVILAPAGLQAVSYTHLRAHETGRNLVCRLLLEKKKQQNTITIY